MSEFKKTPEMAWALLETQLVRSNFTPDVTEALLIIYREHSDLRAKLAETNRRLLKIGIDLQCERDESLQQNSDLQKKVNTLESELNRNFKAELQAKALVTNIQAANIKLREAVKAVREDIIYHSQVRFAGGEIFNLITPKTAEKIEKVFHATPASAGDQVRGLVNAAQAVCDRLSCENECEDSDCKNCLLADLRTAIAKYHREVKP